MEGSETKTDNQATTVGKEKVLDEEGGREGGREGVYD
jgi:hypothetical protein